MNQGGWRRQQAVWVALVPRDLQLQSTDSHLILFGIAEGPYLPFPHCCVPVFSFRVGSVNHIPS